MHEPFAPPLTTTPSRTWFTLWSMGSTFVVDGHEVEVDTWHWTGRTVARIDGQVVAEQRDLGWHGHLELVVDRRRVDVVSRWYPLRPVVVRIDGIVAIDDLFPQLAYMAALGAIVVLPIAAGLGASTLYDLWRLYTL